MSSRVVILAFALTGCTVLEDPPPSTPSAIVPQVPDPRATPTAQGAGRVVLDADGQSAEVSRVISTTEVGFGAYRQRQTLQPLERRETQLLCITPCVVDLPLGAHELVFRAHGSPDTPPPQSTATIVVHGAEPMVVRHALGNENVVYRTGYALGFVSLFAGVGFTLMGGIVLGMAALSKPTPSAPDRASTFYTIGAVVGGIGLTLDVTGILAIVLNRPHRQSGSTTTFTF